MNENKSYKDPLPDIGPSINASPQSMILDPDDIKYMLTAVPEETPY